MAQQTLTINPAASLITWTPTGTEGTAALLAPDDGQYVSSLATTNTTSGNTLLLDGAFTIPGDAEVNYVRCRVRMRLAAAGARNVRAGIDGSRLGTAQNLTSTDWMWLDFDMATNASDANGPWTPATANAVGQLYIRAYADADGPVVDCDYAELTVDYTPTGAPPITGDLDATTPAATVAVPLSAWAGSTSGLPETTGTLTATTPTANIAVPTAAWAGTAQVPSYSGSLDINPDADAVTIEVPLSAWSGTTQTPGAAGTLTTTTPAATIAVPTLDWAGAATIPESTGSLAGALPIVAITTPTSAWAGATTIPEGDGILAALLPTALIAPAVVAWSGGTTAPIYSGLLDTDTPHTLVATPLATWTGASAPPSGTTGALAASLPVITIHTPAMAQATAGPPPLERTLYIAADDRTITITSHDRTITIDRHDRTIQIGAT